MRLFHRHLYVLVIKTLCFGVFVYDCVCVCVWVHVPVCVFRQTVRRQSALKPSQQWSWPNRSLCWITLSSGAFLMSQSPPHTLTSHTVTCARPSYYTQNHLYSYWDQLLRRKLFSNFTTNIQSFFSNGKLLLWWLLLSSSFARHLHQIICDRDAYLIFC